MRADGGFLPQEEIFTTLMPENDWLVGLEWPGREAENGALGMVRFVA